MRHDLPFGACPHHTDRRGWRGCQTAFLSPQHHTPLVSWQTLCSEHLKQHSTPQWHFYLHSIIFLWCLDKRCVQNTWNNTAHHSDISISTASYSSGVLTNAVFRTPETTQHITMTFLSPQHHTPLVSRQMLCSEHLKQHSTPQWHFYLHSVILLRCLYKCCVQNTWNNTAHHNDISVSTVLYSSVVFTNAVFKTPETTQHTTVTYIYTQHHTPLLYWQTCSKHLNKTGHTQQRDNRIMILWLCTNPDNILRNETKDAISSWIKGWRQHDAAWIWPV